MLNKYLVFRDSEILVLELKDSKINRLIIGTCKPSSFSDIIYKSGINTVVDFIMTLNNKKLIKLIREQQYLDKYFSQKRNYTCTVLLTNKKTRFNPFILNAVKCPNIRKIVKVCLAILQHYA